MIITINGYPGSGKTTTGKKVAEKLGYKFVSMGDILGEVAQKHGMTINEITELGKKEAWVDKELDDLLKKLALQDHIVFDSRVGFHFLPKSIKIFLDVNTEEAARRIMASHRNSNEEKIGKTVAEQVKLIRERTANDNKRYMQYYGVHFDERNKYDYWLDTTQLSREEVFEKVMEFIKKSKQ